MRVELYILLFVGLFIADVYYDHKYSRMLMTYKKYFKIVGILFAGFFLYFILKKNPTHLRNIVSSANACMKYIPIDKDSKNMISPLLDLTGEGGRSGDLSFMQGFESVMEGARFSGDAMMETPEERRMKTSGGYHPNIKRCVSETKKKYVASLNNWKCNSCSVILPYYFEVDHVIALKDGGTNEVNNLKALCVDCHKKKTMSDFLR